MWFAYIQFYKITFFSNFNEDSVKIKLLKNTNTFIKYNSEKKFQINKTHIRFSYYIDLYCIEFFKTILLINLFFKTNLLLYKAKKKKIRKKKKINKDFLN